MPITPLRTAALSLTIFSTILGSAQAVIIVKFQEVGPDVQAEVTGSLNLSAAAIFIRNSNVTTERSVAGTSTLFTRVVGNPSVDTYNGGSVNLTMLNGAISLWSGSSTFGYEGSALYVPADTPENDPNFTPTGTWTWSGKSLADVGMGSLSTTPQTVYTIGGDSIQFALAPEPSSSLLLGLAGVTLLRRRTRR